MKVSRNALCPCGSGKKYKHCCLNLRDNSGQPSFGEANRKSTIIALVTLGSLATGIAWYAEDSILGLTVAAASTLLGFGYLTFSNPPPPRENAGNPAGLDFGRKD